MHGTCHSCECPSQICVFPGEEGGWVLESGVWRVDPGRGQLFVVEKEPGEVRRRGSTAENWRGSLGHLRGQVHCQVASRGQGPFPHWPSLHGQKQEHSPKQDQ